VKSPQEIVDEARKKAAEDIRKAELTAEVTEIALAHIDGCELEMDRFRVHTFAARAKGWICFEVPDRAVATEWMDVFPPIPVFISKRGGTGFYPQQCYREKKDTPLDEATRPAPFYVRVERVRQYNTTAKLCWWTLIGDDVFQVHVEVQDGWKWAKIKFDTVMRHTQVIVRDVRLSTVGLTSGTSYIKYASGSVSSPNSYSLYWPSAFQHFREVWNDEKD